MSKALYLVAVDGSEWSLRATKQAVKLAQQTGAKVKIITVLDWLYLQPMVIEGVAPPVLDKATEEKNIQETILTPLAEKYKDTEVKLSTELLWGDPVEIIQEQVKEMHANMLFIGRRGRSRVIDMLLGSVANKLAHRVGLPIVLVP